MKKTLYLLTTLLILSISHLACASSLRAPAGAVVLDIVGNPVYTDTEYHIQRDVIGYVGGLVLQPVNETTCARYAAFSDNEAELGIHVRFHPFYDSDVMKVGHGWRFKVEFTSTTTCAGSGWWSVESPYVVAGAEEKSYFAILLNDEGKYEIAHCGHCAACKKRCSPLGLDGLFLTTTFAEQENTLNVQFVGPFKSRYAE